MLYRAQSLVGESCTEVGWLATAAAGWGEVGVIFVASRVSEVCLQLNLNVQDINTGDLKFLEAGGGA